jgi:hypothetical protein
LATINYDRDAHYYRGARDYRGGDVDGIRLNSWEALLMLLSAMLLFLKCTSS